MHVALVHLRHAGTGGTERYLNHLARHLVEHGHRATIVCRTHEDAPHPDVRFRVLHPLAVGSAWRLWSFARAVERHVTREREAYDVVLGLGKTWTHDVVRLGGGCHATYLELAHGAAVAGRGLPAGALAPKHRLALAAERRALAPGAYASVIANSDMVRRDVVARHGVDPADVVVIPNGVDVERFDRARHAAAAAELRREQGLDPHDPVVLFLGTGYGRKGLDRVLDAFPRVAAERPRARLLIVGYDSALPAWRERAARAGLAERARFLGGRRDVEVCYAAADAYVLPTRYDPFANSTLEALASGLPVVTTPTNGASELLSPGREGSVVGGEPEELAAELVRWTDPERVRAARPAARELARRHDHHRCSAESTAVLERVAARRAARAPCGAP